MNLLWKVPVLFFFLFFFFLVTNCTNHTNHTKEVEVELESCTATKCCSGYINYFLNGLAEQKQKTKELRDLLQIYLKSLIKRNQSPNKRDHKKNTTTTTTTTTIATTTTTNIQQKKHFLRRNLRFRAMTNANTINTTVPTIYLNDTFEKQDWLDLKDVPVDDLRLIDTPITRDCAEAISIEPTKTVHQIYRQDLGLPPFFAYCLADLSGMQPWLIIQRRVEKQTSFFKQFVRYKYGFGAVSSDYFIGLEKIYLFTKSEQHELWIQLTNSKNETRFAFYTNFSIGGEETNYTLLSLGTYYGNAGDSLRYHVGQQFSASDADNDKAKHKKCAVVYQSGWWFDNCYESNLNGMHMNSDVYKTFKTQNSYSGYKEEPGIIWSTWEKRTSLTAVHMAIRPRKPVNVYKKHTVVKMDDNIVIPLCIYCYDYHFFLDHPQNVPLH